MLVECRKVGAIEASDVGALPITPMSVIDGADGDRLTLAIELVSSGYKSSTVRTVTD